MNKLLRAICLSVFLFGVLTFCFAYSSNIPSPQGTDYKDLEPPSPIIITYVQSQVAPDGNSRVVGGQTRYVKADGEWRIVNHNINDLKTAQEGNDSNNGTVIAKLADGRVLGKAKGSTEVKPFTPSANGGGKGGLEEKFRSQSYLKAHPSFNRIEVMLGLKVYVLRDEVKDPSNTLEWVETSYSPKSGYTPLRSIMHYRDGTEIRIEAIKIDFKDVPEDLNEDLKSAPLMDSSNNKKSN